MNADATSVDTAAQAAAIILVGSEPIPYDDVSRLQNGNEAITRVPVEPLAGRSTDERADRLDASEA